jgi:HEAT repeat protein
MRQIVLALIVATVARADTMLPQPAVDALGAIDVVPTESQLTTALMTDPSHALDTLVGIAQNASGTEDPGVRLRAIQGIAKYCPPNCTQAHAALAALIAPAMPPHSGTDVLIWRAAIESIGPLRFTEDLPPLVDALDFGPRDIRAAAAHALRDLCNSNAISALHSAYTNEKVDEVRIAISEALRVLPCP